MEAFWTTLMSTGPIRMKTECGCQIDYTDVTLAYKEMR